MMTVSSHYLLTSHTRLSSQVYSHMIISSGDNEKPKSWWEQAFGQYIAKKQYDKYCFFLIVKINLE